LRPGQRLALVDPATDDTVATLALTESLGQGGWMAMVDPAVPAEQLLTQVGRTPLPPYIRRGARADSRDARDEQRYQTVYARRAGAVAAPTAGLHFTNAMLQALQQAGLSIVRTTLHVGLGTFAPIKADRLDAHEMHREWYELSPESAAIINATRRAGRRVVAVGTTSVRVLETCALSNGTVDPGSGWTNLFCYPPYAFRAVDVLLTNFHLPRSTLLALIMAFAGITLTRDAYRHAVEREYRFFSYGDAMLIL
jgi:S-adenosylmethionine:tRNA ribosyltransferase-isomerase